MQWNSFPTFRYASQFLGHGNAGWCEICMQAADKLQGNSDKVLIDVRGLQRRKNVLEIIGKL